jgi:hypothetical protein
MAKVDNLDINLDVLLYIIFHTYMSISNAKELLCNIFYRLDMDNL